MRAVFGLYAAGGVFWACCALLYGLRSPWWRSATGKVMLMTFSSLAAVLLMATAFRIARPPLWLAIPLACAVLGAVVLAGLVQLINLVRLQRRDRSPR